ncbi:hypothetical protein pb186bvf_014490 [Paramecium bursaria]
MTSSNWHDINKENKVQNRQALVPTQKIKLNKLTSSSERIVPKILHNNEDVLNPLIKYRIKRSLSQQKWISSIGLALHQDSTFSSSKKICDTPIFQQKISFSEFNKLIPQDSQIKELEQSLESIVVDSLEWDSQPKLQQTAQFSCDNSRKNSIKEEKFRSPQKINCTKNHSPQNKQSLSFYFPEEKWVRLTQKKQEFKTVYLNLSELGNKQLDFSIQNKSDLISVNTSADINSYKQKLNIDDIRRTKKKPQPYWKIRELNVAKKYKR